VEEINDFTFNIETIVKTDDKKRNGMGKVMQPFRLSGYAERSHLFDIVEVIGKEETISRIQKTIINLK
jgi:glutamyl-tRNA synthetase